LHTPRYTPVLSSAFDCGRVPIWISCQSFNFAFPNSYTLTKAFVTHPWRPASLCPRSLPGAFSSACPRAWLTRDLGFFLEQAVDPRPSPVRQPFASFLFRSQLPRIVFSPPPLVCSYLLRELCSDEHSSLRRFPSPPPSRPVPFPRHSSLKRKTLPSLNPSLALVLLLTSYGLVLGFATPFEWVRVCCFFLPGLPKANAGGT